MKRVGGVVSLGTRAAWVEERVSAGGQLGLSDISVMSGNADGSVFESRSTFDKLLFLT